MSKEEKQLRLEHARHNEEVCINLDGIGNCYDWVITTAFYSCIHYIKHKVFPLTTHSGDGIKIISTFENYFSDYYHSNDSRHAAVTKIVKDNCNTILADYKQLKDICWGARYTDYRVSAEEANKAKLILGLVKTHCAPKVEEVAGASETNHDTTT